MRVRAFRFAIPVLAASISPSFLSAQQPPSAGLHLWSPYHQAQFPTLVMHGGFKYWDKGFLIAYSFRGGLAATPNTSAVMLYDRDGHIAQEAFVWFKGAVSVSVGDAAVTKSGRLLVAGGMTNEHGEISNFIASIGETGHIDKVIRTTPFLPIYICSAADDGTVWSYGFDVDEQRRWMKSSLRLRQYSFEKGELRVLLKPSVLDSAWSLARGKYPSAMGMRCNSRKVVLYNGYSTQLIELDLASDKLLISRVKPLPDHEKVRMTGFALTDSGDIFASLHYRSMPPFSGLYKLNFDKHREGNWIAVEGTEGPFTRGSVSFLMGASGDDLLYTKQLFDGEHGGKTSDSGN